MSKQEIKRMIKMAKQHGQYSMRCGFRLQILDDHGTPVTKRVSTLFYLGSDFDAAIVKRKAIRASWKYLKLTGVTEWTQTALDDLAAKGIIKPLTAARAKDSPQFAAILQGEKPPAIATPDAPKTEIETPNKFDAILRDKDGDIPVTKLNLWMLSLVHRELTSRHTEKLILKAISNYARENPLGALRMGMDYWNSFRQDLENSPQVKSPVQLNIFAAGSKPNPTEQSGKIIDTEIK